MNAEVTLWPGVPQPVDGLCPTCNLPGLIDLPFYVVRTDGPRRLSHTARCCTSCSEVKS